VVTTTLLCAGLQVRVHLVDTATRELVHALIVATEAAMPNISRTYEVSCLGRAQCEHLHAAMRSSCCSSQHLLLVLLTVLLPLLLTAAGGSAGGHHS
jgi:hypothetical protein